ncbi:MAG: hypothetical protein LBF51_07305 [Zoogloeaceae bacterium]|jgi:hypothetical protein|nr:hypothetical protein [Zoogloeaceae bacterium]
MRDDALFALLRQTLLAGLARRGLGDVSVRQNYQPVQQGRASETSLYLHKVSDRRHGSPGVRARCDPVSGRIVREEIQVIESVIQITALVNERDPKNADAPTAADVARTTAAILQGEDALEALHARGVQALRIQGVRLTPVENERDRFEFEASFDVTLTHNEVFVTHDETINRFGFDLHRV